LNINKLNPNNTNRGSAIEAAWKDRLTRLGVNNAKTRDVIQRQAIRKTLELSDIILWQFHVATHTSPEWALQALSNDISNTTTESSKFYRTFFGPNEWAPIEETEMPI